MNKQNINILWVESRSYLPEDIIQKHSHGFFHYIYVAGGSGEIKINDKAFRLVANTIYLIKPNEEHSFCAGTTEKLVTLEVKFEVLDSDFSNMLYSLPSYINVTEITQIDGRFMKYSEIETSWDYASAFINIGFGEMKCEATILYNNGELIYSAASVGVGEQKPVDHLDGLEIAGESEYYQYYGYKTEDADFINAIANGTKPFCTIDDEAKTMAMLEKMLKNRIN